MKVQQKNANTYKHVICHKRNTNDKKLVINKMQRKIIQDCHLASQINRDSNTVRGLEWRWKRERQRDRAIFWVGEVQRKDSDY